MEKLKVLILDDEPGIRSEIGESLEDMNLLVFESGTPSEAFCIFAEHGVDVTIVDLQLPEMDGIEVLRRIKHEYPRTEVIMITAHGEMDKVIQCMRLGALDFFNKPFRLKELDRAIQKTRSFLQFQRNQESPADPASRVAEELEPVLGHRIIGESQQMKEVIRFMSNVATAGNTTVLVTGESGTGKELVAKGIHYMSNRRRNPFHSINCASIPDDLFESEFFGHVKGAYTGAISDKAGWFEASHRGTLFMDEIGDLKLSLQPKFLRVLDDMTLTRLGSTKEFKVDVRVVAATNQSLDKQVVNGTFRADLYYRLNSYIIHLPPLRERREDILPLFHLFLEDYSNAIEKPIEEVEHHVYEWLVEYHYPGNVRELKHMVERAIILSTDRTLRLPQFITPDRKTSRTGALPPVDESTTLQDLERQTIIHTLKKARYVKSHAARLLNISRQALDRKIRKFGIQVVWK